MPRRPIEVSCDTQELLRELGHRIRVARLEQQLTQLELASRVGITTTTLGSIEHGHPGVSIGTVLNCCEQLELTVITPADPVEPIRTGRMPWVSVRESGGARRT